MAAPAAEAAGAAKAAPAAKAAGAAAIVGAIKLWQYRESKKEEAIQAAKQATP